MVRKDTREELIISQQKGFKLFNTSRFSYIVSLIIDSLETELKILLPYIRILTRWSFGSIETSEPIISDILLSFILNATSANRSRVVTL